MFNCKKIKNLTAGLSAIALSVTVGYLSSAYAQQMKAAVSQPAIRSEYKSADSIQLDGSVSLANGNRKLSVSLRDSDLRQTLRMIADKAGLNIIFHSSVSGNVTLDLVNVTLNDAFKMIMQASDLSYVLENGTLLVMSKDASLTSDVTKQNMMVIPVKYTDASKVADFLNSNVFSTNRPGLSNNKIVVTNPGTNELVLFGTKNDYAMAQKIVAKIDVKPKTSSYKVNYTTPKEMSDLICKSLFPNASGGEGGSSDGGGMMGGAADMGGGEGGGGGGAAAKAIELGSGKLACSLKGSATKDRLTSLGDNALTIMYFPQTGVINVTGGSDSQREMIAEFIKDNDRKQPQAYMEMQIIELNELGSKTFNNTWDMISPFFSAGFGNTGLVSNPLYPTFLSGNGYNVVDSEDPTKIKYKVGRPSGPITISYRVNYLIENGKGRVLANPKLIVTNGQQSLIDLTSDYIKTTEAQVMNTGGGMAGAVQKTYTIEKDNGMSISMTPFISPDGYVTMNIQPKYATIKEQVMDNFVDQATKTSTPIIAATLLQRRNLDLSNIRIKDGETLVIGGLIQETEKNKVQKLPFLGDLPYVGSLFRNTTTTNEKTELVIMVTPRIIKDNDDVTDSL